MNAPDKLLIHLLDPKFELEILVLRCALAESQRVGDQPLIRGLDLASLAALYSRFEPDVAPEHNQAATPVFDEFDELFELLLEHAEPRDRMSTWLAAAIATAAQRDNHLWQDLGLPSRRELNAILLQRFPTLATRNTGDMKWKKFFYRQLCQRAGVPICKSPNCADCTDHSTCFGPET